MDSIETKSVITDKGFKNWTTSVIAHNEAKKALCEIIEMKWKTFISNMTDEQRHHIETFVQCMKTLEIKYFGTERYLSCNHPLCTELFEKFLDLYRSPEKMTELNDKIPCLPASDTCFQYYWNIAMFFDEIECDLSMSDVMELDISVMLRMMRNCQLFAFDDSSNIYDKIFKDRDELFHTSENNISDERMYVILDNIIELLSRLEDHRFLVCNDVISNIKQLKEQDFRNEIEMSVYKLLVEKNLKAKIKALERDMSRAESSTLDEALAYTKQLLLKVKEEEIDEIAELQEENNKLKERLKKTEHERDDLQSVVLQILWQENPLSDCSWRRKPFLDKALQKTLVDDIYRISKTAGQNLLVAGPIGAGKSSFILSVLSAEKSTSVDFDATGKSYKSSYNVLYNKYRLESLAKNVTLQEAMGMEPHDQFEILIEDFIYFVKGHVKNIYKFNPTRPITPNDTNFRAVPRSKDVIHCVMFVLSAVDVVFGIPETYIRKISLLQDKLRKEHIPVTFILTKVDMLCKHVHDDIRNIFRSTKVHEAVKTASKIFHIDQTAIHPVNSEGYFFNTQENNIPILLALKHSMQCAADRVSQI